MRSVCLLIQANRLVTVFFFVLFSPHKPLRARIREDKIGAPNAQSNSWRRGSTICHCRRVVVLFKKNNKLERNKYISTTF